MDKIQDTILRKNRYYIRTKEDENFISGNGGHGRRLYPRANYVWMKYNPSFQTIPKGYVIHHLDLDPTNDDISNLVIMHKFHHIAYHLKHKEIISEVLIDHGLAAEKFYATPHYPMKRPGVYYRTNGDRWFISYKTEKNGKRQYVTMFKNKRLKTKEEAEAAIDKLWPNGW